MFLLWQKWGQTGQAWNGQLVLIRSVFQPIVVFSIWSLLETEPEMIMMWSRLGRAVSATRRSFVLVWRDRWLRTPPGSGDPQTRRRCAASDEVWVKTNSVLHNALIDEAQEHEQVIWLYLWQAAGELQSDLRQVMAHELISSELEFLTLVRGN